MPATKKKAQTVTFMSRFPNLRIVREAQRRVVDNGRDYTTQGKHYEFVNGQFVATEEDDIRWLRAKMKADEEGPGASFSEIPPAPPAPDADLARITELAIRLDLDGLAKLLEDEERGHQRPIVMEQARKAMEALLAEADRVAAQNKE